LPVCYFTARAPCSEPAWRVLVHSLCTEDSSGTVLDLGGQVDV